MNSSNSNNSKIFSLKQQLELAKEKQKKAELLKLNNMGLTGLTRKDLAKSERILERENIEYEKHKEEIQSANRVLLKDMGIDTGIDKELKRKNIILDDSQKFALDGILNTKYACLIGPAGCGKTTLQQIIVDNLELRVGQIDINNHWKNFKKATEQTEMQIATEVNYVPSIAFCAPTGRGTEQMKKMLNKKYHNSCSTIHTLLGYYPDIIWSEKHQREIMNWKPFYNQYNKLPFTGYIFDEAGMFWLKLWNEFMSAYEEKQNSFILLIGDINQLPPPMDKSILGFGMTNFPTFELTKIHRQAEGNPIITNAHLVLKGEQPISYPGKFDIINPIKISSNPSQACQTFLQIVVKLYVDGTFNPIRDAIIVPHNVGILGKDALNAQLVGIFNKPKKDEKTGLTINPRIKIDTGSGQVHYAIGDKMMVLKNDRELGMTNGMVGVIQSIEPNPQYKGNLINDNDDMDNSLVDGLDLDFDQLESFMDEEAKLKEEGTKGEDDDSPMFRQSSHIIKVVFENGAELEVKTAGGYRNIDYGYVFTCHKSQGGEYKNVIIFTHSAGNRGVKREWLYTAITRAQERVFWIADQKAKNTAVKFQAIKGTTLEEKIQSFIAHESDKDKTQPKFPPSIRLARLGD